MKLKCNGRLPFNYRATRQSSAEGAAGTATSEKRRGRCRGERQQTRIDPANAEVENQPARVSDRGITYVQKQQTELRGLSSWMVDSTSFQPLARLDPSPLNCSPSYNTTMVPEPRPVAVVIGASRGIGRQVAIDLAKNGYRGTYELPDVFG